MGIICLGFVSGAIYRLHRSTIMSTRHYPLFLKGNPQLRVFLPNFWMKLIKPKFTSPPNEVHFIVSTEMTKLDVKNYLNKIYKVPVLDVRTRIVIGKFKRDPGQGYIVKEDDYKVAYVTLPTSCKFEFPKLFPEEKLKDLTEELKREDVTYNEFLARKQKNWERPGIPLWFGV